MLTGLTLSFWPYILNRRLPTFHPIPSSHLFALSFSKVNISYLLLSPLTANSLFLPWQAVVDRTTYLIEEIEAGRKECSHVIYHHCHLCVNLDLPVGLPSCLQWVKDLYPCGSPSELWVPLLRPSYRFCSCNYSHYLLHHQFISLYWHASISVAVHFTILHWFLNKTSWCPSDCPIFLHLFSLTLQRGALFIPSLAILSSHPTRFPVHHFIYSLNSWSPPGPWV